MDSAMATETQAATTVTLSYRRNGKLFSCEPCRRGKLRCDHNSPVCGRCARRNKPDQCIYHPAPLTKPRPLSDSAGSRSAAHSSRSPSLSHTLSNGQQQQQQQQQHHQQHQHQHQHQRQHSGLVSPPPSVGTGVKQRDSFRPLDARAVSVDQSTVVRSPVFPPMATPLSGDDRRTSSSASYASPENSSMSFRDSKAGFLGPTSYSAVFTENPGSLSVIAEPQDADDASHLPPVSAEKIQQGAEVLAMLRDMPVYLRFTQRWFDLCDGIVVMQGVFQIWVDELWSEFGGLLKEGQPEQLLSLSELVWRNTRRPLRVHNRMTAREWARGASGRNLRWEVIGTILSMVGLIAVNLSSWDSIFDSIRERFIDRATFADRMRKASEYCLCFCYESEVLNDIYVWFMYEDLVLVECLKGDAHYAAWQRTGEVCDAIVAMGLHQGNRVDAQTPFFLAELRKKIFISAYGHDKVVATFLGRPPRLSYRYCKMEMPLDLSDDQLLLEGPELEAALSTLDPNGWNTSGNLHRTTWVRVWFQHCRIREDILEIALGSGDEDISRQAEQVRLKLERLHATYPAFMRVSPEELLDGTGTDAARLGGSNFGRTEKAARQVNAIFTLCIHAGIAHTEFLLQRALVNRQRTNPRDLIPISRRMLGYVLLAQSKRDFFRDFQGDLVYLMAVHGLPAAGVLAIELLKQEQSRAFTPDVLPRSETIQDLSVFISSLAAVGPGEGNFSICNQGRRALKRVLDQILSPNPLPPPGSADTPAVDDMSLFFPTGNDADFLQWLENVEWDKGNWMNPLPPPDGS